MINAHLVFSFPAQRREERPFTFHHFTTSEPHRAPEVTLEEVQWPSGETTTIRTLLSPVSGT
jgi:hypothetical protein